MIDFLDLAQQLDAATSDSVRVAEFSVIGDEKTLRKNHKSKPRSDRPFDGSAYHKQREQYTEKS